MKKIKGNKLVTILIIIIVILLSLWQYDNISTMYYGYQFNRAIENTNDFLKNETGNIVLLNDPIDNHAVLVQLNTNQKPIASMAFEEFYDEIDNYHNDKGSGVFSGNNIVLTNNTERKSILLNLNTQKVEDVPYITSDNFSATSAEEYTIYKTSGLKTKEGFKNGKMEYHFTEKYPMTIGNEQEDTLQGIADVTIVLDKEYLSSNIKFNARLIINVLIIITSLLAVLMNTYKTKTVGINNPIIFKFLHYTILSVYIFLFIAIIIYF